LIIHFPPRGGEDDRDIVINVERWVRMDERDGVVVMSEKYTLEEELVKKMCFLF
jgi:hypothetical protein